VLNPLASNKFLQMATGIAKLNCAAMRSKSQWYWFSNEILLKKYIGSQFSGTRQPERLCRLHPSQWSPQKPGLSSSLACFEQEVRLGTPPRSLTTWIILWS